MTEYITKDNSGTTITKMEETTPITVDELNQRAQKLLNSIPQSTPFIPSAFGNIYTYANAKKLGNVTITPGDTVAGSELVVTDNAGSTGFGTSMRGTWKCMGYMSHRGAFSPFSEGSLMLRIS